MPSADAFLAGPRRFTTALLLATVLFGLFHFLRLSPVHGWSDDGSVYLQYARNILEGRPYHSVLSGQSLSITSPPSRYPPVLPLLLTPIVYWRGIDFLACKALMLLLFLASTVVSAYVLRIHFPPSVALATAFTMLGAHAFWEQADHINSDFSLLLLCGLLFLAAERWEPRSRFARPLVCAILIVLATATRTVGATLLPALLLYSLWRYRKIPREIWLVCLLSVIPLLALRHLLGGEAYSGQLSNLLNWTTLRRNLIQYPLALSEVTGGGFAAAAILNLVLLAGTALSLRRGPQLWAAFALSYGCVLVFWPFSDPVRFLIPLWPWITATIFYAIHSLQASAGRRSFAVGAVATVFLAFQIPHYRANSATSQPLGLNNPEMLSVYDFTRRSIPPQSVVAFRKPRTFSLITGIRSIQIGALPPARLGEDLCRSGATHLLTAPAIFAEDETYLKPFLDRSRSDLDQLLQTRHFTLYRLSPQACTRFISMPEAPASSPPPNVR